MTSVKKGVGANSILCNGCGMWIHKKCSKVRGKLKADQGYKCSRCLSGDVCGENVAAKAEVTMADSKKIELVDKFCYLGDMIGADGGVEEATRTRIKCAWGKFRKLAPILTQSLGKCIKMGSCKKSYTSSRSCDLVR